MTAVTFASLADMMRDSIADPVAAGRRIISLSLPQDVLWQAFALVVIASAILTELANVALPTDATGAPVIGPFAAVALQAALLLAMIIGTHRIGHAFGGTGDFAGAVHIVVWLQAILVVLQVVQLVAVLFLPPLVWLVGLATIGLFFWLFTGFLMALHGFTSRVAVLLGLILTMFAVALVLSIVLALFGVSLVPMGA